MKTLPWLCCVVALLATQLRADEAAPLALKDGDRVVFVGNDFFDREVKTGYIETALTLRYPKANITFRNLGYSGDTVWANARNLCSGWDLFGPEDQGFDRLKKLIGEIKPTVVFAAYGMNESFEGKAGVERFTKGLDRMLNMLTESGARLVLLSPIAHENLGSPYPDPAVHNADLKLYDAVIRAAAKERGASYVDLLGSVYSKEPITSDGIHLTPEGYRLISAAILGRTGQQFESGSKPPSDLGGEQFEKIRAAVNKKNADFFNYWRSENDTYIFGYRKHEQGRNGVEVPRFLPLVEEGDKKIAALRSSTSSQEHIP